MNIYFRHTISYVDTVVNSRLLTHTSESEVDSLSADSLVWTRVLIRFPLLIVPKASSKADNYYSTLPLLSHLFCMYYTEQNFLHSCVFLKLYTSVSECYAWNYFQLILERKLWHLMNSYELCHPTCDQDGLFSIWWVGCFFLIFHLLLIFVVVFYLFAFFCLFFSESGIGIIHIIIINCLLVLV